LVEIQLNTDVVNDYLQRNIRLWLGLKMSQAVEIPEMPMPLRSLFLREEEYLNRHRDQWGEWEHSFSLNYQEGKLWVPEIDYWLSSIRDRLVQEGVQLEKRWPNEHKFAVCLTHDVDLVSEHSTFLQKCRELGKYLRDETYGSKVSARILDGARPVVRNLVTKTYANPSTENTIEVVLDMENEFGVVSSFFFPVCPSREWSRYDCVFSLDDPCRFRGKKVRVSEVMRIMVEQGFDVGLHGSYHSATDVEMLREQKNAVEKATGEQAITTRQHWLHWDMGCTPQNQHLAGFLADSTLGFNRNIGFRSGVSLPYYLFDVPNQETIPLLEVAPVLHEGALFAANSLEYDLDMAVNVVRRLIDRIVETCGCMTVVLHPHSFVDKDCVKLYRWFLQYCTERGGWLTSLKGVFEWWAEREAVLDRS
jgi:hypothetical protein